MHAYVRILPQVCAVCCRMHAVLCVVVVGCVHVGLCSCVIRAFCVIGDIWCSVVCVDTIAYYVFI